MSNPNMEAKVKVLLELKRMSAMTGSNHSTFAGHLFRQMKRTGAFTEVKITRRPLR